MNSSFMCTKVVKISAISLLTLGLSAGLGLPAQASPEPGPQTSTSQSNTTYKPSANNPVEIKGLNTSKTTGDLALDVKPGSSFTVEAPESYQITLTGENNVLMVTDSEGSPALYTVAPEGMKLALSGNKVTFQSTKTPSALSQLSGTQNTQRVVSPNAGTALFGVSLIKSVRVENQPQGRRYIVTPTVVGRAISSPVPETAGWSEAKAKGVANTNSLRNQYVCHPLSQVARVKSSWNLESWRPDVGLPATLRALCNPGGGGD